MFDQRNLCSRTQLAKVYLIHVRAHKENASPGRPKEVFLGERVGNFVRIEPGALVRDTNSKLGIAQLEAYRNVFGGVLLVAMEHGVYRSLTGDHGNIGRRILVKAGFAGVSFRCFFDRMNALELSRVSWSRVLS